MRIGLIADTHLPSTIREPWPEVRDVFEGVDLILHAGDMVSTKVLDWLDEIAPTLAARGNGDGTVEDDRIAIIQRLKVDGWRIAMTHDMEPEDRPMDYLVKWYLAGEPADVVITGHTHYERIQFRDGVLQVNSGSATHPHVWSTRLGTVGLLEVSPDIVRVDILRLGETPELRNPGVELHYVLERSAVPRLQARADVW
jgi:putative phosphoesterase